MQPAEEQDRRPGRRPALVLAMLVLAADLVTKQVMLDWIFDPPRRVPVLPFLDFVPVWNPGISFGMLASGGIVVTVLLTVLAFAVAAWMLGRRRDFSRWNALAPDSLPVGPSAMPSTASALARWLILSMFMFKHGIGQRSISRTPV